MSDDAPLEGLGLRTATFIVAADVYGHVPSIGYVVRRDVATARPGGMLIYAEQEGTRGKRRRHCCCSATTT